MHHASASQVFWQHSSPLDEHRGVTAECTCRHLHNASSKSDHTPTLLPHPLHFRWGCFEFYHASPFSAHFKSIPGTLVFPTGLTTAHDPSLCAHAEGRAHAYTLSLGNLSHSAHASYQVIGRVDCIGTACFETDTPLAPKSGISNQRDSGQCCQHCPRHPTLYKYWHCYQ